MRKIKLQTAVSLAEIVTAIAVVASLLYAANEFRLSRQLNSTDVEVLLYERMLEMDRQVLGNNRLAELLTTADPDRLSPPDTMRVLAYEHIFYDSWELAWAAHDDGVLDEDAWNDWNAWFEEEVIRRPSLGWAGNRKNYGEAFIRYVEDRRPAD